MFYKSSNIKRRAIWGTAITAMLGTGALLLHAFNPQPDPPRTFGIFGITPLDAIRLNVTNIAGELGLPPDPCRAQIGFVNANGVSLKTETVTLSNGESTSIALSFTEASRGALTTAAVALHASVRPVISFVPPGPCFAAVSAEVTDAITGRTNIYAIPESKMPAPAVATNTAQ